MAAAEDGGAMAAAAEAWSVYFYFSFTLFGIICYCALFSGGGDVFPLDPCVAQVLPGVGQRGGLGWTGSAKQAWNNLLRHVVNCSLTIFFTFSYPV